MKTKYMLLVALCAIITLSFTFTGTSKSEEPVAKAEQAQSDAAPAGGFLSADDKF